MSSGITLQANMRQGLSSLQLTSDLLSKTQERLSTGKKVNSSLDNPLSFASSQALSSRSSALSDLMNGMSNAVQTVKAANTGAQNIGKTLDSIKGIINQAKAAAATTTQVSGTAGVLTAASAFAGAANDKLTITNTTTNSTTNIDISSATSIQGVIEAVNSGSGGNYTASIQNGSLQISAGVNNLGSTFSASVTNAGTLSGPKTTSLFNQATAATSATTGGATQTQLTSFANQINDLMDTITSTGNDASFNGTNLLKGGSNLRVQFNEDSSSKLDMAGSDFSLSGLTVAKFASTGTTTLAAITGLETGINAAKDKVSSFQGAMSNNLTIVQNRQDFTRSITDILETGSANLVNADMNEEAAKLQALNTRQSIGQSSLSLSNQANQGVLQLLR